jgi:hypothetical protein
VHAVGQADSFECLDREPAALPVPVRPVQHPKLHVLQRRPPGEQVERLEDETEQLATDRAAQRPATADGLDAADLVRAGGR